MDLVQLVFESPGEALMLLLVLGMAAVAIALFMILVCAIWRIVAPMEDE